MLKRLAFLAFLLPPAAAAQTPQVPISSLPPATTPLTGAEQVPIVQSGVTRRAPSNSFPVRAPTATTSGGIFSVTAPTNNVMYGVDGTGMPLFEQLSFANLSGLIAPTQIPAPTALAFGGILAATAPANQFEVGNIAGVPQFAQPSFANIAGVIAPAQIPPPTTTTRGGVVSAAAPANQFQTGVDATGTPTFAQPAFSNLSGVATGSQLPAPTATAFGGVLAASAGLNQFQTGVSTTGAPTFAQPQIGNLGGAGTGVLSALGIAVGTAGAPVVNGGALGKPSAGDLTNAINYPFASLTGTTNAVTNAILAQAPTLTIKSNITGSTANDADNGLSAILDAFFGATQGQIVCRGSSGWAGLPDQTSGYVLTATGSGTCPSYQAAAGGGGGSAAPHSTVRQTVQTGPAASGLPNFLAATSASLAPTFQNITSTAPLVVAAAQSFGATGQVDTIYQSTSNPTGPTCPASGTDYLFENASTGTLTCNALQPIYQCGGTIGTTSGQFTFDYCAMVGYLGNGSAAPATPLVALGECTAGASSLSGCVAYAYNGLYVGSQASLAAGTSYNSNTNLGVRDVVVTWWLECVTADQGYAVGDRVYNNEAVYAAAGGVEYATLLRTSGRNAAVLYTGTSGIGVATATGTTSGAFTVANWKAGYVLKRTWGGA